MRYKDLNVRIDLGPEGYSVEAQFDDPTVGDGKATFELPEGHEASHRSVAQGARHRALDVDDAPTAQGVDPTEFGVELYNALFHGETLNILNAAQALSNQSMDSEDPFGIRIRLQFDLDDKGASDVASLPWELMRPTKDDTPLATSSKFSLVRFLKGTKGSRLLDLTGQLRIMLVVSNPVDVPALEGQEEANAIKAHLGRLPGVKAEVYPATKDGLREGLSEFKPHVLHYIGHGTKGALVLEDESGKRADFSGELLRPLIEGRRDLRLVFLNACDTAVADELDPWEDVAASIFRVGAPAVVAMQFPIHDDQAKDFAGEFYRQIAAGAGMETALSSARQKLHGAGQGDWATPVMFLRGTDEGFKPTPIGNVRKWAERVLAPVLAILAVTPWLLGWREVFNLSWPPDPLTAPPLIAAGLALAGLLWMQRRGPFMTRYIWGGLGALGVVAVLGATMAKDTTVLSVVLNPAQMDEMSFDSTGKRWELLIDIPGEEAPIVVSASSDTGTVVVGTGLLSRIAGDSDAWSSIVTARIEAKAAGPQGREFERDAWDDPGMSDRTITRSFQVASIPRLAAGDTLTAWLRDHGEKWICEVSAARSESGRNVQDCFLFDQPKEGTG